MLPLLNNTDSYEVPLDLFLPTVEVKSESDAGEISYNNETLWTIKWTNMVNGTSKEFTSTSCQ